MHLNQDPTGASSEQMGPVGFDLTFISNAISNRNSHILKDPRASHLEMKNNV